MTTQVVNRFGETSTIKLEKMRDVLKTCSEGLDVNLLALESHVEAFEGREIISTSDIQKSLIYTALTMCSATTTDYSHLASRLLMYETKRQNLKVHGYDIYTDMNRFIKSMHEQGKYTHKITYIYGEESIKELQNYIKPERDFIYDYSGMNLVINRYLMQGELPQIMFMVIAMLLGDGKETLERVKEFYDAISTKRLSLATPILSNLRKPNGSLSSCFITTTDDTLDGIFNMIDNIAKISANGGGVGINMSRVRPNGAMLHGTGGGAKGVIPWIKIINDTMVAVDQGGCVAKDSYVEILVE